jgi:chromosome segregation ATPase
MESTDAVLGGLRSSVTAQEVQLVQLRGEIGEMKVRIQRANEDLEEEMAEAVRMDDDLEHLTRVVAEYGEQSAKKKEQLHEIIFDGNKTVATSNSVDSRQRELERERVLQTTSNAEYMSLLSQNWVKYPKGC